VIANEDDHGAFFAANIGERIALAVCCRKPEIRGFPAEIAGLRRLRHEVRLSASAENSEWQCALQACKKCLSKFKKVIDA
jgi:hypothetical protein